ncbi:MAG: hypothetical protein V3U80_08925 [Flavobacteriaceae bacterium]
MSITYNFSEYSEKGNTKTTNNNSCKAVKTNNGDLFIIADVKGDNGKQAADVIADTIVSFLSGEKFSSNKEALTNALKLTQDKLAALSNPNDVKKGVSVILFDNGVFTTAATGDHRVALFSDGKIHHLTNSNSNDLNATVSNGNILLKKGDVLLSSSNGLTDALDDNAIEAIFNTDESVAFKTKHLLDNSLSENGSDNISIQTIEITGSDHNISVFTDVKESLDSSVETAIFTEKQESEQESEFVNATATETTNNFTEVEDNLEESVLESELQLDEDETYEDEEDLDSGGFPLKKLTLFLIPLLLAFLAYKYYPLLIGDKSDTQEEIITTDDNSTEDTFDTTTTTEGEENTTQSDTSTDSITNSNTVNDSIEVTEQQNNSTNIDTTVSSENYFTIGENNVQNNTYKNIYQYTKHSGSSLTMDDIISLNPNYKSKKDGDKVYLK